MGTTIRKNERSWGIDLISKINSIASHSNLLIKIAGGESTISTKKGNSMFPDVILYGDTNQSIILQGWELKMPDVLITNDEFIADAQRKANALNLNSCFIWNFTYAVLYIKNKSGDFEIAKQWSDTSYITTREDVKKFQKEWETLLEKIIYEINNFLINGTIKKSSIENVVSESTISEIINRNKESLAEKLKQEAFSDSSLAAFIDDWWLDVKNEYEQDENDGFMAYAKVVILNWANRILFAHLIKNRQNEAKKIESINKNSTAKQINLIFEEITQKCDFYNVFSGIQYNEHITSELLEDLIEFSNFLSKNSITQLKQESLQSILESSVSVSKRSINGQYTTPPELAKILLKLTVNNWNDNILDCCCGTGTIPKSAIEIKRNMLQPRDAIESVWACDKNKFPLQIANISMTDYKSINIANRIFQHNALTLKYGEKISITNPDTGNLIHLELPLFGAIVSNLPFVQFESIPKDDLKEINALNFKEKLDGRADLYCYIVGKVFDLLKNKGRLGIIVSNSWTGTESGKKFISLLREKFRILQIHTSGNGRWFKNAKVVANLLILEKDLSSSSNETAFILWKKTLDEIAKDSEFEKRLISSSILKKTEINDTVSVSVYSHELIQKISALNISYNALFHNISWLPNISNNLIKIKDVFNVIRGSRRGWDKLFFPPKNQHSIEDQYIKRVLFNGKKVPTLETTADGEAFCCGKTISQLKAEKHFGALNWIRQFEGQKNGVGEPLPKVLARKNQQWYELKENEIAEFFTIMNPDKRLFFAIFDKPSFINQRIVGLNLKNTKSDKILCHALLNSVLTLFFIEASGFGRGEGVLDINKNTISECAMFNPDLVSSNDCKLIKDKFNILKQREIKELELELKEKDRIDFEKAIFNAFNITEYLDFVIKSVLSLRQARASVKN